MVSRSNCFRFAGPSLSSAPLKLLKAGQVFRSDRRVADAAGRVACRARR